MEQILIQTIAEFSAAEFSLDESSIHGISHWTQVEFNGIFLGRQPETDLLVVRLFAYLHDCKREDDWEDPFHGERSSEFVKSIQKTMLKDLSKYQIDTLVEACKYHHTGAIDLKNPTIGACFDSDRLELNRCGILPKIDLMSTPLGKRMATKMQHAYSNCR